MDEYAQLLMTLAGMAYGQPSDIPGYLAKHPLTSPDWSIHWIAAEVELPIAFAFIARNERTGAYAVAIRGTYPNPLSPAYWDDASFDNPTGPMHPWSVGNDSAAKVSAGTWAAFQAVIALSDGSMSFAQALRAIGPDAVVYVTGHSLGGTLAPVIALWLTEQPNKVVADVYAFAGMTPGNRAFANLFATGSPLAKRVRRYNNDLDTVPYGWDRVWATRNFYSPHPSGGLIVKILIALMALRLKFYGFAAIGTEHVLHSSIQQPAVKYELVAYVLENLRQHMPANYLALLGAPPLPFTLDFGSVVSPRANEQPSNLLSGRLRTIYLRKAN